MKKIALALLLIRSVVSAQTITKKDGSAIDVSGGKIFLEAGAKRLAYVEKDAKKPQYVKFKDLQKAVWDDFVFQIFNVDGKEKAYYLVSENADKKLVAIKRTRIKSRGGFESAYTHYELAVIQNGKTLEELTFTDVNNDKQIEDRGKIIPMIKAQFPDCPKLIEKVAAFESPSSDTKNATILVLLNEPTYIPCK